LIKTARPIVVHDHIHLAGLDEIGVEVDAHYIVTGKLRNYP